MHSGYQGWPAQAFFWIIGSCSPSCMVSPKCLVIHLPREHPLTGDSWELVCKSFSFLTSQLRLFCGVWFKPLSRAPPWGYAPKAHCGSWFSNTPCGLSSQPCVTSQLLSWSSLHLSRKLLALEPLSQGFTCRENWTKIDQADWAQPPSPRNNHPVFLRKDLPARVSRGLSRCRVATGAPTRSCRGRLAFLRGPSGGTPTSTSLRRHPNLWEVQSLLVSFPPWRGVLSWRALAAQEVNDVLSVLLALPSDVGQCRLGLLWVVLCWSPELGGLFPAISSSLLWLNLSTEASRLFFQQKIKIKNKNLLLGPWLLYPVEATGLGERKPCWTQTIWVYVLIPAVWPSANHVASLSSGFSSVKWAKLTKLYPTE